MDGHNYGMWYDCTCLCIYVCMICECYCGNGLWGNGVVGKPVVGSYEAVNTNVEFILFSLAVAAIQLCLCVLLQLFRDTMDSV